jgi:hypothetical protein
MVARRCLDDFVDAVGAVDDGELGVKAQMNEHAGIVEKVRPMTAIKILTLSLTM